MDGSGLHNIEAVIEKGKACGTIAIGFHDKGNNSARNMYRSGIIGVVDKMYEIYGRDSQQQHCPLEAHCLSNL